MIAHTSRTDSHLFVELTRDLLAHGCRVRFQAPGSSMYPTIRDAERVTVAPVETQPIARGDVLLFRHRRGPTAHRVIGVRVELGALDMRLRGDNSDSCDGIVAGSDVLGRVVAVERGGSDRHVSRRVLALRACRIASRFLPRSIRRVVRRTPAARLAGY